MLARVAQEASVPEGFSLQFAHEEQWRPYPVPGIRMKVLASTGEAATQLCCLTWHRECGSRHITMRGTRSATSSQGPFARWGADWGQAISSTPMQERITMKRGRMKVRECSWWFQ